jgi:hypothetical protein
MSASRAILFGAILIAFSIFVSNGSRPASAYSTGQFEMMHHSNTTANVGVFRMDTATGEISYCYLTANSDLVCTRGVK